MSRTKLLFMALTGLLCACATQQPESNQKQVESPDIAVLQGSRPANTAAAPAQEKPMLLDELIDCAIRTQEFQVTTSQHNAQNAVLKRMKSNIDATEIALEKDRKKVNVRKSADIKAYNRRVDQLRADVNQFNEEIAGFNREATLLDERKKALNLKCGGRSFKRSDLEKMPPDLRASIEAHTKR